jgi:hypothetical protein
MEKSPANLGEGNPEAAAEFNEAEQKFVSSHKGQKKIRSGPKVRPDEESALIEAEESAKARGRNDDSDTDEMRMKKHP